MEDNLKKKWNGRRPNNFLKNNNEDLKKMEEDLKKNGRRPQTKIKKEDDLKKKKNGKRTNQPKST
jgi:hypothetical protein